MPLRNITKKEIPTKYNSIEITVKPGEMIDVRDYDVNAKSIPNVELAIMDKYGRKNFEQMASKDKILEQEVANLKSQLAEKDKVINSLQSQIDSLVNQAALPDEKTVTRRTVR